ncbi:MAG: M28 family peptidase [Chloroflexi bacterium]|nr:M28 family peptidase [Chloroflexota bacterium]MBU1747467.1 M28 family peptidase [Chloroflexota bacterium]
MTDLVRRLLGQESRKPRWVIPTRQGESPAEFPRPRGRFRRSMLVNLPFLLGLLIVGTLIAGAVLAPRLAPHNPYALSIDQRFVVELGNPPYPPSDVFPLGTDRFGRDILSILLYGASTTLIAAGAVTIARLLIGLTLGSIAGWFQNSLVDSVIMGVARFLSAFPILLAGMILILALDIRQGLQVFVVALAFVGWSELAQYIRAEFMTIKQQPFIESARAVGLSGFGIAVRHVLPNVLPSLIALSALEMGGVLMLLGELGFLSVFVGGGAFTTDAMDRTVQYATVPEWGAMLAGTRLYARTYPWLALWPAATFFLAVVGFNLLGEGFRRIIEESGVNIALLISKRALVGIGLVVVALWFMREYTGPLAAYVGMTEGFDVQNVLVQTRALTTGDMAVRPPGSPGATAAAEYIAQEFRRLGLQPWGDNWETYFQHVEFQVTELGETPRLAMLNPDGSVAHEFVYRQDFRERLHRNSGPGQVQTAGVTFLALNSHRNWGASWYQPSDRPPDIGRGMVMMLEEDEPPQVALWLRDNSATSQPVPGLLVVTDDPNRIQQQSVAPIQASMSISTLDFDTRYSKPSENWWGTSSRDNPTPTCYITPETANRLLAGRGLTVADLRQRMEAMSWDDETDTGDLFIIEPLPVTMTMSVEIAPVRVVTAANVVGFLPGTDTVLDRELVVVVAHYDGLPQPTEGAIAPGAVDNAASIATMLEIARLWQEQGFQPRRTIMFVAVAGGENTLRALEQLQGYHTIFKTLTPVAFIQLDGIGGGSGDKLLVSDETFRLHALATGAAGKLGVNNELFRMGNLTPTSPRQDESTLGTIAPLIRPPHWFFIVPPVRDKVPTLVLRWQGSEDVMHHPTDTVDNLDADKAMQAGRVVDLMLRILARETTY